MIELKTKTFDYYLNDDQLFWKKELEKNGAFQIKNLKFVLRLLSTVNVGTIVDVGANIGMNSLFYSLIAKTTIAFEPQKNIFDLLCKNIEKNKVDVMTQRMCIGEQTRSVKMKVRKRDGTSFVDHLHGEESVEMVTLDKIFCGEGHELPALQVPDITFIKIDTEGYEYPVIVGAKVTLAKYKPILQIEMTEKLQKRYVHDSDMIFNFLGLLGYAFAVTNTGKVVKCMKDKPSSAGDLFWIPSWYPIVRYERLNRYHPSFLDDRLNSLFISMKIEKIF